MKLPPDDSDCTSDLSQWFHCSNNRGLPDTILNQSWDVTKCISFVFHHRSVKTETVVEEPASSEDKKLEKKKLRDESEDEDYDPPEDNDDEDFHV